jgi:hypothetical protein
VSGAVAADWVVVGAGDLNRDGFADVVLQQQSSGATLYANMANGVFSGWGVVSNALTPDWDAAAVADLTGDGFAEVVFQNLASGDGYPAGATLAADVSSGAVQWNIVTTGLGAAWRVEGTADIDNDGLAEILFQNAADGATGSVGWRPAGTIIGPNGLATVTAGFEPFAAIAQNITADWQLV